MKVYVLITWEAHEGYNKPSAVYRDKEQADGEAEMINKVERKNAKGLNRYVGFGADIIEFELR